MKDDLEKKREELVKQREQIIASFNQTIGAIAIIDELLREYLDKKMKDESHDK